MKALLSFYKWISKHRVLDGYIGILSFVMHYRILADYGTNITIASLNLSAFHRSVFGFHIYDHKLYTGRDNKLGFPYVSFGVSLFGFRWDSAQASWDALDAWSAAYMKKREQEGK